MKKKTVNLNDPDEAREYLYELEKIGILEFEDDNETSMDLDDESAVNLASKLFNLQNKTNKTLQ